MKKYFLAMLVLGILFLQGCSGLSIQEKQSYRSLQSQGITIDHPIGLWEKPASPVAAGFLNLLPGCGNFYLACGNAGDSEHFVLGFVNMLFWPFSAVWGIPEAVVDADNINKRDMIHFYTFDIGGEEALAEKGLQMNKRAQVERK